VINRSHRRHRGRKGSSWPAARLSPAEELTDHRQPTGVTCSGWVSTFSLRVSIRSTYMLAGKAEAKERGWRGRGDNLLCMQAMGQRGQPIWSYRGIANVATHILRRNCWPNGEDAHESQPEEDWRAVLGESRTCILPMSNFAAPFEKTARCNDRWAS